MAKMIAGTDYSGLEIAVEGVFNAIFKGRVFNTAILANIDIFGSDLVPTGSYTTFRIYACLDTAGVLTVRRTRGGVTVSEQLNAGVNLAANAAYMFDILVEGDETINLQYSVNAVAISIKVFEVPGVTS